MKLFTFLSIMIGSLFANFFIQSNIKEVVALPTKGWPRMPFKKYWQIALNISAKHIRIS